MASEFLPVCGIQKIALYKTKSRFYLVGSNTSETKFRVLKIDRTVPSELVVIDDKVEYDQVQIRQLLAMIDDGNRPKNPKAYDKDSTGLHRTVSAFGIVGFVRFLEGYYIILISEREKVAQIGVHTIYKIMDTCMVPIPNETVQARIHHDNESKYLKSFQNVDLSSNFYFSYTYDLTQSLQFNMSFVDRSFFNHQKCRCHLNTKKQDIASDKISFETQQNENMKREDGLNLTRTINTETLKSNENQSSCNTKKCGECFNCVRGCKQHHFVSIRSKPYAKFVWNMYMLKDVNDIVHPDWLLYITHGFIGQCNISVYGRPLYLTLIARRSNEFAGTRFLKRGSNDMGYVANDVETEQIVNDASTLSFQNGGYTSFVQTRGSVPLFWSQDLQHGVVPKPPIQVDRSDPYYHAAAQHFNRLMERFGSPIIVFNLVKKRERKRREQILGKEFKLAVDYLNQFLPPRHIIKYIWFDLAKYSKIKQEKVIEKLKQYAEEIIELTGFFHSGPNLYVNETRTDESWAKVGGYLNKETFGREQTGVPRVNCVDCLDRTNIAQFVIGKHVLALQLYTLGVIDKPVVNFDCDAVRLLEELYEDHGDTLALQYGGSQLVHRIRTYLKTAPWTSHSRDIYQTLCRYYSGAFTDSEKQQAINLFLGKFIPGECLIPIWEHPTDYYFHHVPSENGLTGKSYTKWFDDDVISSLPLACHEVHNRKHISKSTLQFSENVFDLFRDYYRPEELSELESLFSFNLLSSFREFLPDSLSEPSPFIVRVTPATSPTNHLKTSLRIGRSTSPTNEEASSDSDHDSDSESEAPLYWRNESCTTLGQLTFQDVFSNMEKYYGVSIQEPSSDSLLAYQSFAAVVHNDSPSQPLTIVQWTAEERGEKAVKEFSDIIKTDVSLMSVLFYGETVSKSKTGQCSVSSHTLSTYELYFKSLS